MKKVIRKLADVIPDSRNANKGTKRGRKALAASISKYGAGRSILVDRHGVIIAGNKTAESAVALKSKDVLLVETDGSKLVVVQRTDLDMSKHKKARELALADNRASELNLVWDEEVLAELAKGMDPDALWSESELRKIVGDVDGGAPEPKLDQAAELQRKWGTARGQIWEMGKHRLMCGDSTDAEAIELLMGGGKATMCFTDPPWNVAIGGDGNPPHRQREASRSTLLPVLALCSWLPSKSGVWPTGAK